MAHIHPGYGGDGGSKARVAPSDLPGMDLDPQTADDNALLKSQIKSEILEELADLLADRRRGNNSHRGTALKTRRRSTLGNLAGGGQAEDDDAEPVFDVNDTAEMKALPLPS